MNIDFLKNILTQAIAKGFKKVFKQSKKKTVKPKSSKPSKKSESKGEKVHPWRACPIGEHWVVTHPLGVPVSERRPDGLTIRHGHCADNPIREKNKRVVRDYLRTQEMSLIAEKYFQDLTGPPNAKKIMEYENADKYDSLIRGWTKYWNEIFKPTESLDPNLVKAQVCS